MSRIFTTLALIAVAMMAAALLLGFYVGDLHGQIDEQIKLHGHVADQTKLLVRIHLLVGLATALTVVLVNSIVVTYFIGTGRWCKEVAETYSLGRELVGRSVALKRRTFPWAVLSMLVVVGVIALGAAADPGTRRPDTADWTIPHLVGALAGVAFIVWSFWKEAEAIRADHEIITQILDEVHRIRTERGLEV